MRKTLTLLTTAGALAATLAGCGSASKAPGVVPVPSGGATTTTTTTTTTTSAAATVTTPASGPLSKEPTIAAGTGTPPKTLQIKDIVKGTGAVAEAGDTVTVNYVGALYKNGKVFDASWKRDETFTTLLANGHVITGWVKGIAGMKVGGRRELIIPPSLGYHNRAYGDIPASSTLIFIVDLLKVTK